MTTRRRLWRRRSTRETVTPLPRSLRSSTGLSLFPADVDQPTRADLDTAIAGYWDAKGQQLATAQLAASTAEGSAKAVRGGKHFAPIALLIARFFLAAGYPPASI